MLCNASFNKVMAELPKIDLRYLKEAFKEPINFWGMAGFAVAAAYVQDLTPLVAALAAETLYLATVPASSVYRRLVDRADNLSRDISGWLAIDQRRRCNECGFRFDCRNQFAQRRAFAKFNAV